MGEPNAVTPLSLLPEGSTELLDRYQLIGEIASGGMASVFLARLPGAGGFSRLVAIKRLHPHLAGEPEFVAMFLDEARIAASIHHRNVVPILEIGSSDRGYYLVMEYVEGLTLAKMMTHATLTRNLVPRGVLLRVMVDTLLGLHAAHELTDEEQKNLGVVHRDCSPQNILIGLDGTTRITDFGIARARSRLHNTREGSMKGKLAYMAPEQTNGEGFDRRADIFSVGVVLWEILAERRLFKATTEAATLRRLLHDPIPRLNEYVPDVGPALEAVSAKALARNPTERFATAAEMADALVAAARATGTQVATEREVEMLMKQRYGADAHEQRDAVRTWLQATPTTVGPRGPQSEDGFLTREHSGVESRPAVRASRRAPATQRSWPPDRPRSEGAEPAGQAASAAGAHPRRPLPPPRPAESEDTHIYDPPSLAERGSAPADVPSAPYTDPQPSLPLDRRRGRWALVVAALLAVGVAGVLLLRSAITSRSTSSSGSDTSTHEPVELDGRERDAPDEREPKGNEEPGAAPSEAADAAPSEAADAAPSEAATAEVTATAQEPGAVRPAPPPRRRRPPMASPSPPPKPEPESEKVSPPKPQPPALPAEEADDLSNPYR